MNSLKQTESLRTERLVRIARKATATGFSKAVAGKVAVVYTDGEKVVERQPDGEVKTIDRLKNHPVKISQRFKLK